MRRVTVALILAACCVGLWVPGAQAHPLGNFSVNHLTQIKVDQDRVRLHYILDQAEIPTFQERDLKPAEVLARKRAEVAKRLRLSVDGRDVALRVLPGAKVSFPPGQGGLTLTRVEIDLAAAVSDPERVVLTDETFNGRVGWKAIVAQPGEGTDVRSSAPSGDPTKGLRSYPTGTLSSPLDERVATLTVRAGSGSLVAPRLSGAPTTTTSNRSGDGFAAVFANAAAGQGVLVLVLLAAFAWGAFHALAPGHGKAMVAAYLVGMRGTPRHAFALGATVTVTHTIGVFALGIVTLALSQYLLPEQLYPWLTLTSGLLVLLVGAGVLRSRIRWARRRRASEGGGSAIVAAVEHGHDHAAAGVADHHDHSHGDHDHGNHDHGHGHAGHHHHMPEDLTWRGLLVMGTSAGLLPCPSALVVLLAAIAQHQIALGLLLIAVFSLGLATTLTALGLVVIYAGQRLSKLQGSGRLTAALPSVSALIIVAVGCLLTIRAIPGVLS